MIAVGGCIGSGIFITPSQIASHVQHPYLILSVWLLGGIISVSGALTFAELGGMFPKAGGVYVFLREAYGDWLAFLYGWIILTVITSGALAALSLAFARFLQFFIDFPDTYIRWIGVGCILFLSIVNVFGIKIGEILANIFTSLKLLGVLFIVVVGLLYGSSEISFEHVSLLPQRDISMSSIGLALVGVLWSYGGWYHASYLASETMNPERNVPRAIMLGALIVLIAYVFANVGYLMLLSPEGMSNSSAVASDAIQRAFQVGAYLITFIIIISVFGSIAIYTVTAPRVYFAMAEDKVFFKQIARLHPKYSTPANAIMIQALWSVVLILFWGTFENLITYVVFMDWIFMVLGACAIFVFRKSLPDKNRPYKTWGYPIVPLIFVIISIWFVLNTLIEEPKQALVAGVLAIFGLILFWFYKRKNAITY